VEVALTAVSINGTDIVHAQCKDLSEQHRIQKALVEKEKQYKRLVDTLPEVVFVHRHDLLLFVNQAVTPILGYDPLEMIGSSATDYVDEPYRKVTRSNMEKFAADIEVGDYEVKLRTKTGNRVPVLVRSQTIIYDDKQAILSIFFDITERKKIEEQLRHSQKLEAVGQLASGVAHDFNNIITAIMGYGGLTLKKLTREDPLRSHIDTILSLSERAATLTGSLLAFSRKQPVNLSPIDLNTTMAGIEKLLTKLLTEDIELTVNPAQKELIIMADNHQIEQVIMNLVANARDAMPEGGKLCISTYDKQLDSSFQKTYGCGKPGKYGVISVSDNGMGMDKQTKQRIFEPFFTTKEVGKGTGLGLATVYGIIQQHNGYITVDTVPGQGATFNIYIPLNKTKIRHIEEEELPFLLRKGSETILIAEDDTEVRKLHKNILEEYNYTVIVAEDGLDAIEKFITFQDTISLAILDVVVPRKNGKEVYEEIKKIKPHVQVLFTSGHTTDVINTKGILNNGADFIAKPMKTDMLLKRIREILDKQ
jgi:PAS domain S-box-containing protein